MQKRRVKNLLMKHIGFQKQHPKLRKIAALGVFTFLITFVLLSINAFPVNLPALQPKTSEPIKWVNFDVPYDALDKAMNLDIESYNAEVHLDWIQLLSYLGANYGGDFKLYKAHDLDLLAEKLQNGESLKELTKDMKYYDYYNKAYSAVLGGFLGEFKIQVPTSEPSSKTTSDPSSSINSTSESSIKWETKYGLKAFSPIAKGYWYEDYDDFGAGRSYGYDRKHFGHDLLISTGTPIIAVESGIVEATGWNQYGGWRIGIRSFDKKRYYYYAHLRKDRPYSVDLYEGKTVKAGDVIGYSGRTGYSIKENVNNIDTPHLHYGMQLIFDEAEKDSPNQIWIDMYSITNLLSKNKSAVCKNEDTKEYYRKYEFSEPNFYQEKALKSPKDKNSQIIDPKVVASLAKSKAPEGSIPLPIIMYHGLVKDTSLQNEFFISPTTFENDLKYLQEKQYTPIFMQDLIDYVDGGTPLPKNPIILSFDDGYYNNYLYAYPLLKEYHMKGVISIIGKFTDKYSELDENNAAYSHVTWDQIKEMQSSGTIEIQNHSYNMHTNDNQRQGAKKVSGESLESYENVLQSDIGKLQLRIKEMTGKTPTTFAYPFGFISNDSQDILKEMGFQATLGVSEGVNYITRDPEDLYQLKRLLRPLGTPSQEFFKNIIEE